MSAISGISTAISGISSVFGALQTSGASQVNGASADSDGDNDGGGRVNKGGRGQFAAAVFQALSQAGVSLPTSKGAKPAADSDGDNDTAKSAGSNASAQALHAFIHTLFQTIQQGNNSQSPNTSTGNSGTTAVNTSNTGLGPDRRAQFEANASQLLQSLTAGNANSNTALSALQTSFQNLLQAQGTASASSATAQPTLQSFLQSLVQDLGGNPPQSSGNIVQTKA